jgi:3-deoxy-manno-octulosonate cytidylyltransferase (CMP-KDO synthetase)
MYQDVAVIIPSRLEATRLPGKPLAQIGDMTMIEHVITRIKNSGFENVYVATDSQGIADIAKSRGAIAIMTDKDCPTGTDRVYQAFLKLPGRATINYVINVQGDMPFVDGSSVREIVRALKTGNFDIITPVVKVGRDIADKPDNVKVVADQNNRAMYFSRSLIPHDGEVFLYHVGIYGFTKDAITKFVNLKPSEYEKAEKLEQLRALENGLTIGICYSTEVPISVDTELDLANARKYINVSLG